MDNKINIQDFFNKGTFVIPEYQRGYKWSVKDGEKESSLEFFLNSLIKAYEDKLEEYFIEAVTIVAEEDNKVILVDGQQRTTSLFLLFVALGDKVFVKNKLRYKIRLDSHNWLNNQVDSLVKIEDEDVQDIYYFKKALEFIKEKLENTEIDEQKIDKQKRKIGENEISFLEFIKRHIFLLYNPIPKEKAVNTFIALNGLKAVMKDEELIKSDLLIKSSRMENQEKLNNQVDSSAKIEDGDLNKSDILIKSSRFENNNITNDKDEQLGVEWKINEDRGRLARNWDKWLYWWNKKDVRTYFGISDKQHPLYYLLVTYLKINREDDSKTKEFSFDNFKAQFIDNSKNAKLHFEGLRKLQKTFEDLYNDWETYNLLGLSLNSSIERKENLEFFILNRERKEVLSKFVKWSLVGCTLIEINEEIKFYERREELRSILMDKNLFESDGKNQSYIQLLRMNVLAMRNRKFDFEVFKTKSLEHICPQTPPENDIEFVNTQVEINEKSDGKNSIGNLVLLNGSVNSALSNLPLHLKKQKLFDKIKDGFLLPHTLKVFSKSFETNSGISNETISLFDNEKYWLFQNVIDNKVYFFNEFDKYYGK